LANLLLEDHSLEGALLKVKFPQLIEHPFMVNSNSHALLVLREMMMARWMPPEIYQFDPILLLADQFNIRRVVL
jgi:hypothetical protein